MGKNQMGKIGWVLWVGGAYCLTFTNLRDTKQSRPSVSSRMRKRVDSSCDEQQLSWRKLVLAFTLGWYQLYDQGDLAGG